MVSFRIQAIRRPRGSVRRPAVPPRVSPSACCCSSRRRLRTDFLQRAPGERLDDHEAEDGEPPLQTEGLVSGRREAEQWNVFRFSWGPRIAQDRVLNKTMTFKGGVRERVQRRREISIQDESEDVVFLHKIARMDEQFESARGGPPDTRTGPTPATAPAVLAEPGVFDPSRS